MVEMMYILIKCAIKMQKKCYNNNFDLNKKKIEILIYFPIH